MPEHNCPLPNLVYTRTPYWRLCFDCHHVTTPCPMRGNLARLCSLSFVRPGSETPEILTDLDTGRLVLDSSRQVGQNQGYSAFREHQVCFVRSF